MSTLEIVMLIAFVIMLYVIVYFGIKSRTKAEEKEKLQNKVQELESLVAHADLRAKQANQRLAEVKSIPAKILSGKMEEYATANGKTKPHLIAGLKLINKLNKDI